MIRMYRLYGLFLLLVFLFSVAGCGKPNFNNFTSEAGTSDNKIDAPVVEESVGLFELGDKAREILGAQAKIDSSVIAEAVAGVPKETILQGLNSNDDAGADEDSVSAMAKELNQGNTATNAGNTATNAGNTATNAGNTATNGGSTATNTGGTATGI